MDEEPGFGELEIEASILSRNHALRELEQAKLDLRDADGYLEEITHLHNDIQVPNPNPNPNPD